MEGDTVKKVVGGGWRLVALIHHQQHFSNGSSRWRPKEGEAGFTISYGMHWKYKEEETIIEISGEFSLIRSVWAYVLKLLLVPHRGRE